MTHNNTVLAQFLKLACFAQRAADFGSAVSTVRTGTSR